MEALALLDIDQEDDNLLIASSPENENAEPLLGVSPPSPTVVTSKKKRQAFGDSQNCPGEIGDPGQTIATCKNLDERIAASDPISVLSALDLNAISISNIPYDGLGVGMSKKAQCAKDLMKEGGISEMPSMSKDTGTQMVGSYIHSERQQRQEIRSPEKIEEEPVVLRRNRSRRLTTFRESLAWDKAFFTDEGVLENEDLFAAACDTPQNQSMPELTSLWNGPQGHLITSFEAVTIDVDEDVVPSCLAGLQVPTKSTHARPCSLSRAVEQMQRTSLSPVPRASQQSLKQSPGVESNSEIVVPKATTKSQVKEPGLTATGHHQVRSAIMKKATNAAAQMAKTVQEKISANATQNGTQQIIMHSLSTPAPSLNGSFLSHKVSSISKKAKDTLGKVIPAGRGPITSAIHSQQHVHTSGKTSAVSKRSGGLPTIPAVKDPIKRVESSALFASDTTTKGVFTVRDMSHAKDTSSPPCTTSKKQVPSIPRNRSAKPPPGLIKCSPGSIQDHVLPQAEPLHTGKPSGLRKPSPKLGFFDSARALAGPQTLSAACQKLTDARQAFQTRGPTKHSSIGMHSRTPMKDTGGSNSNLQALLLGKGSSAIPHAPHLQSDIASAPATPRACLTSPATPQRSSSKSIRLPVQKGSLSSTNSSGSECRGQMADTPRLNGKRLQSDISERKTVDMAIQATDSALKVPQFNRSDGPDFESVNDIQCLPELHHAQASALCAKCDAKNMQCRLVLETEGGDCSSMKTIFSPQLPEGDITPSGDHGADSNKEALAASYCMQDSDHVFKTEGGDCSSVQTSFSLSLADGDITWSGDHGADSKEQALAASYCVQDSDHELETEGGDCGSVKSVFSQTLPEGSITQRDGHGADSNEEVLASSYCVQDSDHVLETKGGDCGSVKMHFSISLSKGDVSPRDDYGTDSNENVLPDSYCVHDADHELAEGGDCGNLKTIFSLSLSKGDISQRADYGTNSNNNIAATFCVQDSDNELEAKGADCVNAKTGFSPSFSEGDISGGGDHGAVKAGLTASYCVQDLNHELGTNRIDCGNVKPVFQVTLSEDDMSPRGDYGADSNKEALTARECVQDSECEVSGGQSNSGEAVSVHCIAFASGNIASAQNCGPEQVETSGSSGHTFYKEAVAWMAMSDCLQNSEIIQSVLLLSPCNKLLEAPTETGSHFPVEARESLLLHVSSMKTADFTELVEFSATSLCTVVSGDDEARTEEMEVTSLPDGMTPVITSSLELTPGAACDQHQKLDCQQSCFTASESIPLLPAAGMCSDDTRRVQSEQSSSLSSNDFGEASPKHSTPPVTKESFCQKFEIKHSWQYNSPTSKGFSEASATLNSLPAPNRSAQNSVHKKHWHSSLPGSRIGARVPPKFTTLTPVPGKYRSLFGGNDPADATVTSSPIEANSGLLLLFEQHQDAHTAINAPGLSNGSPEKAERKTLDSPLSQWSEWPVLGASVAGHMNQSDDTTLLKCQVLRPPTEHERGLICDRSSLENDSLTRTPARKVVPVETDGSSNQSPLTGPNVSNAHSLNMKEKGSLLLYARKAVSQLTASPMSANAQGQENFGTLITCKTQQSRTPGKSINTGSKPLSPFSEERICVIEAAGKESLQVKSGPVKHSPPEKIDPEPNPWSPVRKNGRQLGPFDCTKLNQLTSTPAQIDCLCKPAAHPNLSQQGGTCNNPWTAASSSCSWLSRRTTRNARLSDQNHLYQNSGSLLEICSPLLLVLATMLMYIP